MIAYNCWSQLVIMIKSIEVKRMTGNRFYCIIMYLFCIEFYTQVEFMPQPFDNILPNDVTCICN